LYTFQARDEHLPLNSVPKRAPAPVLSPTSKVVKASETPVSVIPKPVSKPTPPRTALINCPLCDAKVLPKNLQKHKRNRCPKRIPDLLSLHTCKNNLQKNLKKRQNKNCTKKPATPILQDNSKKPTKYKPFQSGRRCHVCQQFVLCSDFKKHMLKNHPLWVAENKRKNKIKYRTKPKP
jgi:hypothetical protein